MSILNKISIVFFGSDDFAKVSLEKLFLSADFKVVGCVTQPDRPKGRGLPLNMSVIKEFAGRHQIPVFQPLDLKEKDFSQNLRALNADLFVVIAYGRILPKEILSIPFSGCVNVHGSLLPRYRGAAPINWAILNGDHETGVSIIKMNPSMDAGDIVAQQRISIDPRDTAMTLRFKMAQIGAEVLLPTLKKFCEGSVSLKSQDSSLVTYAPKLTRELGLIDWKHSAQHIYNQIRGLKLWPGAYTYFHGKMVKILDGQVLALDKLSLDPGQIIKIDAQGLLVNAGQDALLVSTLQPESGKEMVASSFVSGYRVTIKDRFQ